MNGFGNTAQFHWTVLYWAALYLQRRADDACGGGLARIFRREFRAGGQPRLEQPDAQQGGPRKKPTAAVLVRHLLAVAPPQHHALMNEWVNGVTLYDFQLDTAASRRLPNGKYEVTLRVTATKEAQDRKVSMREAIEVGVFSAGDKPLYLQKHALRDGTQDLRVIVDREPSSAAVDPYITRIDRNRFDNVKRVTP